jgi:hypothetical protein
MSDYGKFLFKQKHYKKIFEGYWGIKVLPGFDIHHKDMLYDDDGEPLNNDISNLILLTHAGHTRYHCLYDPKRREYYASPEHKAHLSDMGKIGGKIGGKTQGAAAVESGQLARARTPEHQSAAGKIGGAAVVASGQLASIASKGGKTNKGRVYCTDTNGYNRTHHLPLPDGYIEGWHGVADPN